ncbi:MAG TPA: OmpA family protein [Bryobacteraceae bacterium]|nr:OmpA family protein [Bryobacteraceae bacterium]
MKPKYLQPETSHRDRWTVSYLDVMTILLIFFIAAAAKTVDAPAAPSTSSARPAPAEKPASLSAVEQNLKASGLDVHREARGLVISLAQQVLFAPGDDRVSASAVPTVEQIATVLRPIPNRVMLVGYADSTPIHNRRFRDNWELSAARGLRLLELLSGQYGIDESRLSVSSEGANRPRGSNQTPDGRAQNRRVEIVILENFSDVL